jgi:hypothetical protein
MEHKSINLNAIKKSWQSFSTMKRFVSEANRLENASWRLWYIHKNQSSHGLSCNEESIETSEEVEYNRTFCVYCEMHIASLSCNGCCHDAYCVSCFKLIHKKGNLATHTAIKIIKVSDENHFHNFLDIEEFLLKFKNTGAKASI